MIASCPDKPPHLLLAPADAPDLGSPASWAPVDDLGLTPAALAAGLPAAAAALGGIESRVLEITPSTGDDTMTFQAVVQVINDGLPGAVPRQHSSGVGHRTRSMRQPMK